MRDVRFEVRPGDVGWRVESPAIEPMMYLSGAAAEAGANALAARIARAGADSCVIIHDRQLQVIGTRRYFGPDAAA